MATITGLTADRMQEIIDATIVDADVIGDNLILTKDDGSTINAGNVRGPAGSSTAGGIAKVTAFPTVPAPTDGDVVVRTDISGDPLYKFTDGVWELQPRMGAVNVPGVKAIGSGALAIPNNTQVALTFPDTEGWDTEAIHDPATNSQNFVVKTPGIYMFSAFVLWTANPAGMRELILNVNGATDSALDVSSNLSPGIAWTAYPAKTLRLAAGDVVRLDAWQNSGSSLNITTRSASLTWIGGAGQTVDERGVPACRVTKSAIQTVPTGGTPLISFDQEDFDTDGIHDNVTNNTRMTCKTPGLYSIEGSINWASNTSTLARTVWICKNGTRVAEVAGGVAGQFETVQQIKATLLLAAGDYIELQVYQNSGSSIDIQATTNGAPHLSMTLVGSGKTVTPYARAYNSVTQAIPGGTNTAIGFNSERSDNDTMHDPATNNTRMVAKTAGVYAISAHIGLSAQLTTGRFAIWLRKTFASGGNSIMAIGNIPANAYEGSVATLDEMAVGDYYEVLVFSAGAVTVDNGQSYNAEFAMVKVGAPIAGQTGLTPVEGWHLVGGAGEPAFQNAFANWGAPHAFAGFYKDPSGVVHLKGLLLTPAAVTNKVAFTLPVGYRPAEIHIITTISGNALAKVQINVNGDVQVTLGASSDNITLGGMTFRADGA
jgi:hypothetical protein